MISSRSKGLLFGLCSTLIWGTQYSMSRFLFGTVDGEADALALSMVRFLLGALALAPFLCRGQGWRRCGAALRERWWTLMGLSAVGCLCEGVLALASTKFTTAARSSLLCNASPIFTVLVAAIAVRRWPAWTKNLGMVLGFAGLAFALTARSSDLYAVNPRTLPGDLMAIGSGLAWAIYTVLGVETSRRYGGVPCTALILLLGGLMMVPICLMFGDLASLAQMPPRVWAGIAFLGIADTGWAIALWYTAMGLVEPDALGAYGYLSATIALVLSRLVAHESFDWRFFVAAALVMGGVALMNHEPRVKKSTP